MYVQIYYFSNKLLGGILSQDKKDERVFLKLLRGLKILWQRGRERQIERKTGGGGGVGGGGCGQGWKFLPSFHKGINPIMKSPHS